MFHFVGDIKGLDFNFDRHKHLLHTLHDTKRYFYGYYHTGKTTNLKYLETL